MPGLFAAGGLLGPSPSLQRMRLNNQAASTLEGDETKVAIADVTGQQPGAENVSTLGQFGQALGLDVSGILGKAPASSSAPASPVSPTVVIGGLVFVGGLVALLATRS